MRNETRRGGAEPGSPRPGNPAWGHSGSVCRAVARHATVFGIWAVVTLAASLVTPLARGDSKSDPGPAAQRLSEPLCGRLCEHEGLPVLELWGSPEQAGYAHGFLLADRIVQLIDGYMLDQKIIANPQVYETMLVPSVRRQFVWRLEHERELEAMARGMRDRLGADKLRSAVLDRSLKIEDLMAANAISDWFGMMCSTLSAWGSLTADGRTITARNLDFPSTTTMERSQTVLIYHGDGKSEPWIGVTWPGMVGVYTGMSRAGVTMMMHDARGLRPSETIGFTPRSLILREALEKATQAGFIEDVRRVFQSRRVLVGNNIHVSGPRADDGDPPAAVFEYDANSQDSGVTIRTTAANGASVAEGLWCTNHQRLRTPPRRFGRYELLEKRLGRMAQAGEKLDPASALELIGSVKQDITLHSVCCVPHQRTIYVSIPAVSDQVAEFRLDEWLSRRRTQVASEEGEP